MLILKHPHEYANAQNSKDSIDLHALQPLHMWTLHLKPELFQLCRPCVDLFGELLSPERLRRALKPSSNWHRSLGDEFKGPSGGFRGSLLRPCLEEKRVGCRV